MLEVHFALLIRTRFYPEDVISPKGRKYNMDEVPSGTANLCHVDTFGGHAAPVPSLSLHSLVVLSESHLLSINQRMT